MTKTLIFLFPLLAIAQTPQPPQVRRVEINGERYFQISADKQNQVLVKDRTDKSDNEEEEPSANNQYERLPVLSFKMGIGQQIFSNEEMSGPAPNGREFAPNDSNMGAALDFGVAFRVPTRGFARRISTGFLFNISQSDTPTVLEDGEDYIRNRQGGLLNSIFKQWTLFSEYDVLILKGKNTKAISVGAYYDNHIFQTSTCCFNLNEAYRNVHDVGGVARMRFIRDQGRSAFSRWEVAVYAGQGKTFRVTVGVEEILSKKRINPPVTVVK